MGWLIALAVLVLLACLPLGGSVRYNESGLRVQLLLGHIRITLYPVPGWLDRLLHKSPKEEKKPKTPQPKAGPEAPAETGGDWKRFLPLLKTGLDFLGDFRRKLRVNRLELKLILAGGDPCDLAVNYGRAWAAVGNLMPRLERLFVIKKRDVEVECDFTASETLVIARLDLTVTLGRLLGLAIVYGIRALKEFLKLQKKRKGGATHEPDSQYA